MSDTEELRSAGQLSFDIQDDGSVTIAEEILGYDASDINEHEGAPLWIWHDHVIFNDDVKREFLNLPQGERPKFVTDTLDKFYANNIEYANFTRIEAYKNPLALLQFFKDLTLENFTDCSIRSAEMRFEQLQKLIEVAEFSISRTPVDAEKLSTIWPILQIRDLLTESEMAELYYLKNPRLSPREQAKAAGAIMTINGRLADISSKNFRGWLDEVPNPYAYISYTGNKHYFDEIKADPEGNLYEGLQRFVEDQDKRARRSLRRGQFIDGRLPEHERINKPLMYALLKMVLDTWETVSKGGYDERYDGRYFLIHVPTIARELNKNYRTGLDEYDEHGNITEEAARIRESLEDSKPINFMDALTDLNYWVGMINNMPTQIIAINRVDYKTNTIRVDVPYIFDALRSNDNDRADEAAKKERNYLNPGYDFLLHASIASDKDPLAVDLAITIINHILQRGVRNDSDPYKVSAGVDEEEAAEADATKEKTITIRVKYSDLLKETPLLNMAYKNASTRYKYDVLQRRFKKAFKILEKKTDIYEYYKDLNIPQVLPSIRTIDNYLVITHKGYNPDYKKK